LTLLEQGTTANHGEIPPKGVKPLLGIDIGEYGTDANAACLRYGGYVPPLITWNGVDTDQATTKALQLHNQYNVDISYVDGTGVGSSVAPSMSRQGRDDQVRAVSVKASSKPTRFITTELGEFKMLRDQLWWAVREWLRTDQGAMLPPDELLVEELRAAQYEKGLDGKIKITNKKDFRQALKRSPDRADALCLTFCPYKRASVIRLMD
jgi:hypothetical protein